ncbi:MAG: tetratricopeptide repeat protein, partial [Anaerolineae bacterium]
LSELLDLPATIGPVVVAMVLIGFPVVVLAAWVYELTPEGIKRERDVDRSRNITPRTGRMLDRIIIVVLVLALGYFVFDKFYGPVGVLGGRPAALERWDQRPVAEERKSIAVLPFTNMTGDPENEPFTLGMHDDLLTRLSRIAALKTTSRTTVMQYRDTTKAIPEIAEELEVGHILEGGVQRSGDRVRINLQLIDAGTDEHIWAEVYDRELTAENLFQVQADIAEAVAVALQATLLPAEQDALDARPTESLAAYDLYLLGRFEQQQRTEASLTRAVEYFERALEEDPDYALAYAGLAESWLLLMTYGNLRGEEVFPKAKATIDRAMALEHESAEVWAAKGLLHWRAEENREALAALERAIELDMEYANAWVWYSQVLYRLRRYPERLEALEIAISLEPFSFPGNVLLGDAYSTRGRFEEARQHYQRARQTGGQTLSDPRNWIIGTWFYSGELARAIVEARAVLERDPANIGAMDYLRHAYRMLGDYETAERWAGEAEQLLDVSEYRVMPLMAQGRFDEAIEHLLAERSKIKQAQPDRFLYTLFWVSYLAGQQEAAESYLKEWLGHRGGRMEIYPTGSWQWGTLLVADWLIRHGDNTPGGARRGRRMLEEIDAVLRQRLSEGYRHPNTWFGIARLDAQRGRTDEAFRALDEAVSAGFRDLDWLLRFQPDFRDLREDPRFDRLLARIETLLDQERTRLAGAELAPFEPVSRIDVAVPPEVLARYEGFYTDGGIVTHVFVGEDGRLRVQPPLQPVTTLRALSETEFYLEIATGGKVEFMLDESGAVSHGLYTIGGQTTRFKPAAAPAPRIILSDAAIEPMIGRWETRLFETVEAAARDSDLRTATIRRDGPGQLRIDFDDRPELPLEAIAETRFQIPGLYGT